MTKEDWQTWETKETKTIGPTIEIFIKPAAHGQTETSQSRLFHHFFPIRDFIMNGMVGKLIGKGPEISLQTR